MTGAIPAEGGFPYPHRTVAEVEADRRPTLRDKVTARREERWRVRK